MYILEEVSEGRNMHIKMENMPDEDYQRGFSLVRVSRGQSHGLYESWTSKTTLVYVLA